MTRNHKIIFIVSLLFLALQTVPSLLYAGEQKYLVLDGKKVMLNATKVNVKAMFPEAEYTVTENGDMMTIAKHIPFKIVGFIRFRNNKAEIIMKQWGDYEFENKEEGVQAFMTLLGLVETFTNHKSINTRLMTSTKSQPDVRAEMIFIGDGLHSIGVSIEDRKKIYGDGTYKAVNISEYISLSPWDY